MSGPILSRDEINALLHENNPESLNEEFINALRSVAENMTTWLSGLTKESIKTEGPYVERVGESLDQNLNEESYLMVADIGTSQVFSTMSRADAELLGSKLDSEPMVAMQTLGEVWMKKLAQSLGKKYNLFQPQQVGVDMLAKFPTEDYPLLIRHLIGDMEFCLLIKPTEFQTLETQQADRGSFVGTFSPEDSLSNPKRGKLLKGGKSPVSAAQFSPLELASQDLTHHDMNLLDDIDLLVTVELGQVNLTLNEILELKPQSVISLDSHAGDPADIYVNENLAAKGEVVVLDENFGVRILEVLPKSKRIRGK